MVRFGILAPNRKRPRIRLFEAPKHLGTGKLGPKRGEMLLDEGGGFFGRVFYISGRRDSCNPRGVVLVFFFTEDTVTALQNLVRLSRCCIGSRAHSMEKRRRFVLVSGQRSRSHFSLGNCIKVRRDL